MTTDTSGEGNTGDTEGAETPPDGSLRLVGDVPTAFDIITRSGVVDALWGIFEDSAKEEGGAAK
jgi:hypothetical protein